MLVLLTARYAAGNKKDSEVLSRVLSALGMESGGAPESVGQSGLSADFRPAHCLLQLDARGRSSHTDLFLHVSDPLLASQIVKKNGGKIVPGLSDEEIAKAGFLVRLPSGGSLHIGALPAESRQAQLAGLSGSLNAAGKRFGIVAARFNAFITERLLQGAFDGLVRSGARSSDITIVRVPGAFEIPLAARKLAETGASNKKKYDAILCIGCLLRGDTAHYDVIVNEVTRGIGQSAQETGVPHAFGVLTCDTLEQAIDRAGLKMGNKGLEAATAAIEMANLQRAIVGSSSRQKNKSGSGKKRSATRPSASSAGKKK